MTQTAPPERDLTILPKGEIFNLKNKFFYGETVIHKGNGRFYTICDLSNADQGYYGMWPLGMSCAVPTHGAWENDLEHIVTETSDGT